MLHLLVVSQGSQHFSLFSTFSVFLTIARKIDGNFTAKSESFISSQNYRVEHLKLIAKTENDWKRFLMVTVHLQKIFPTQGNREAIVDE